MKFSSFPDSPHKKGQGAAIRLLPAPSSNRLVGEKFVCASRHADALPLPSGLGTSTVTTFVESSTGISEGARGKAKDVSALVYIIAVLFILKYILTNI